MKKITLLILYAFFFSIDAKCSNTDTLMVINFGNPVMSSQFNATGYYINGVPIENNFCSPVPSIHIAIIDSVTCNPLNNCNRPFGQANIFTDPDGDCINDINTIHTCRARPENYFIYRNSDNSQIQHMAQLLDSVENGHIIIAYSAFSFQYSTMDTSFRNVFQRLGSIQIPTMPDTVPFIFVCRKGDANSIHEVVGLTSEDSINISMTYQCALTGIEETYSHSWNIFPNPANNELYLYGNSQHELYTVNIYDALGRKVFCSKTLESHFKIPVSLFAEGFYFVEVAGEEFHFIQKITLLRE